MPSDVTGTVEVAHALRDVLKTRLASVIVYGSAATGDLLPGYSDLDLLVLIDGALDAEDALRLHAAASGIELDAYAYVQPTFARPDSAKPLLVDGSFTVIEGAWPPPNAIQGDDDLRANGEEWLSDLPQLVRRDLVDWSLAAVDVHRRARLALTRLKPAIRALLVRNGVAPTSAWAAHWDDMTDELVNVDRELRDGVARTLACIRLAESPHEVGDSAMRSLLHVCSLLSGAREPESLDLSE